MLHELGLPTQPPGLPTILERRRERSFPARGVQRLGLPNACLATTTNTTTTPCNARDSSRAKQCAARVRRKNGTTVVVRCRTPKVSLGHSSRLSPRVNCAEAGATCGIAGPLRFFVFSEKLTESRRNKPSFWSRESQNDARRASTGRAVALTESAYRSVKQNQLDQNQLGRSLDRADLHLRQTGWLS